MTGWLVYDSQNNLPPAASVQELDPFDDFTLIPYDQMALLPDPDKTITLDVIMGDLGNGAP